MSCFRFQTFEVEHDRSSMRVGTDAVLLGSCALNPRLSDLLSPELTPALGAERSIKRVLDVGCGCGVIALMMAQRFEHAFVEAIDIDSPSVEEARRNFECSKWASRMKAEQGRFQEWLKPDGGYDCIISNPPFYAESPMSRTVSRHLARDRSQLPFIDMCQRSARLLSLKGVLALILPEKEADIFLGASLSTPLHLQRRLIIHMQNVGHCRQILEFGLTSTGIIEEAYAFDDLKLQRAYLLSV